MSDSEIKARYFQREAFDAALFAWDDWRSILIQLGTGGGKTIIATMLAKAVAPARVLFVADQDELCAQPLRTFARYGLIAGLEKSKDYASLGARVVVASAQTLERRNRLERYRPDHFDYILIDEAHRGSDRDKVISDYFETAKICGFTATPFRQGLADLSKYYEHVAYSMPLVNRDGGQDLIALGFAPPVRRRRFDISIDLEKVRLSFSQDGKDFNLEDLETTLAPEYRNIAECLAEEAAEHRTLAFLPLIKSSEAFAAICRSKGLRAIHVDGKTPNRQEILYRFEQGEYQVLCNASVVSTGVDIPTADALLNLCVTKSMSTYQQRFGRIMRPLPGVIDDLTEEHQATERRRRIAGSKKPHAVVFDLLWQHDDMTAIRPEHLFARDQEQAAYLIERTKKMRSEQDLAAISAKYLEERERKLKEALQKAAEKEKRKLVTSNMAAALFNDDGLMQYTPVDQWEFDEPNPRDLEILKKFGIDPETVPTAGVAKVLKDECLRRAKFNLSSLAQLRLIRQLQKNEEESKKVQHPERMTHIQLARYIDRVIAQKKEKYEAKKAEKAAAES